MLARIVAVLSVMAVLTSSACGSPEDAEETGGDGLTFTDDRGTRIELASAPERLVVQSSMAAALSDLGLADAIVGTFGPLEGPDGGVSSAVAGLDVDRVTDVTGSGEDGDVDLAVAAELEPDLIVASSSVDGELWHLNDAVAAEVKKLAPIAVVTFEGRTLPELLDATERLAEALGADLESGPVTDAHESFDVAAERVRELAETLEDRTVLAGAPADDVLYASSPEAHPDLMYWRDELGLPLVEPTPDQQGDVEPLSWENADTYPADVFLYDDRVGEQGLELLEDRPVFQQIPAAEDEAYVPWTPIAPPSCQAHADLMNRLVEDVRPYL